MDQTHDTRLRDLLSRAAQEPSEQRRAFLYGACGNDPQLRAQVEALLTTQDGTEAILGDTIPSPFVGPARSGRPSITRPSASALHEGPGTVIGRYKLLEQIGEGGFGVVFMAEQMSPVRRKVALKIIKLGMDTHQVIARFEAERQALALMDHPHVAKVLDGGATRSGRPFFVMELVRGVPITEFCDTRRLTTRQRLELFVPVCRAIQHAHQKGIIHRDLKPSNVLVTLHDDKAVPMIIDFGIAKATQGRLTDKTLFTEFRQMVGTPAYMSPEQAQLSGLDVDTRSDIYSLGVLLYELLTGTTPLSFEALRSAPFEEVQRMVREVEAPTPSTRLSTMAAASLNAAAEHRRCDPRTLSQTLKGDLDWIILKCLEKDRARRYETANGLARDIQRYLADEPVEASPPSASYKLRKLARRYRTPLRAAATILVFLVTGIIVSAYLAVRATRAETAANRDLRRATDAEHELRQALDETRQATAKEQAARRLAQITMGDMQTALGLIAGDQGETEEATLWFANAAALTQEDPLRQRANRVRWKSWLRQCPAPVNALPHQSPLIRSLAIHPSGRYLLVTDIDDQITLWALEPETPMRFPPELNGICGAAWSPDGKRLALGTLSGDVGIYEFPELRLQHRIGHRGPVRSLLFHRDGQRLALASDVARVWDCQTGSFLTPELAHPHPVKVMSFNPSGDRLATVCTDTTDRNLVPDGRIRIFKVPNADGQPLFDPIPYSLFDERGHVGGRPVAPMFVNGTQFISWPSRSYPARITWREADSGKLIRAVIVGNLDTVAVSPDGRLLATGNVDGLRTWAVADGRPLTYVRHRNNVLWATFSADGKILSTACADGLVRRFLLSPNGQMTLMVGLLHQSSVHLVTESAQLIATAQEGGLVRAWQVPSGDPKDWLHVPLENAINRVSISADGQLMLTSGTSHRNMRAKATQVLEVNSGRPAGPELAPGGFLVDAAMAPNSNQAALISSRAINAAGVLHFWDWKTGQRIFPPLPLPPDPRSLAYSPTEPRLAVICGGGQVLLIDTTAGKVQRRLNCGPVKYLTPFNYRCNGFVRFSPDGRRLLAWGLNDVVYTWDVSTGEEVFSPMAHGQQIHDAQFSRDGHYLATASSDNTVRIWDLASGKMLCGPLPHPDHVFRVCFSADGNWVLTACRDAMARLWDWRNGSLVCPPFQHFDEVFDAAFVGGGPWIITASKDATVRVWEWRTGKPVAAPWFFGSVASSVEVASDSRFAIASGFSGRTRGFDLSDLAEQTNLDPNELILASEILSAKRVQAGSGVVKLTPEEWLQRWQQFRAKHPDFFRSKSEPAPLLPGEDRQLSPAEQIAVLDARLKLQSRNLGPDDPDTLRTMFDLGRAYRAAGRAGESIRVFEGLLKLCEAKLSPADSFTQDTMNDLALTYMAAGRLPDAATVLEKCLNLHHGAYDVNSLRFMSNLAGVYRDLGRLEAAVQLYEKALTLRRETLGPTYNDTLATIADLVPLYIRVQQFHKAESLLLEMYRATAATDTYGSGRSVGYWPMYAMQQLVKLYEAQGMMERADVWRKKIQSATVPAITNLPGSSGPG